MPLFGAKQPVENRKKGVFLEMTKVFKSFFNVGLLSWMNFATVTAAVLCLCVYISVFWNGEGGEGGVCGCSDGDQGTGSRVCHNLKNLAYNINNFPL